jgi:hypothetical protein
LHPKKDLFPIEIIDLGLSSLKEMKILKNNLFQSPKWSLEFLIIKED